MEVLYRYLSLLCVHVGHGYVTFKRSFFIHSICQLLNSFQFLLWFIGLVRAFWDFFTFFNLLGLKKYQSKFQLLPLLKLPPHTLLPHPHPIIRKGKVHCFVEDPRPSLLYLGWRRCLSKENGLWKANPSTEY